MSTENPAPMQAATLKTQPDLFHLNLGSTQEVQAYVMYFECFARILTG